MCVWGRDQVVVIDFNDLTQDRKLRVGPCTITSNDTCKNVFPVVMIRGCICIWMEDNTKT